MSVHGFSKHATNLNPQIYKGNICYKTRPCFSRICWSISVLNKGSEDQYYVTFLEVPESIQKVLEYVREPKLAILELLKAPHIEQIYLKNKSIQNKSLKKCSVFWARLKPVLGPIEPLYRSVESFRSLGEPPVILV